MGKEKNTSLETLLRTLPHTCVKGSSSWGTAVNRGAGLAGGGTHFFKRRSKAQDQAYDVYVFLPAVDF